MGPFDLNGVQASSGRIALRYTSTAASESWNLDDFTVSLIPDCPSPVQTSVQASNVTDNSATITFTDNDASHTAWTVYYKPSSADNNSWLLEPTNSTTMTLSNLNSSTQYDVYVITNCGTPSEVFDATNTIHFTTTQVAEALPFTATFPASGEWMLNNGTCSGYWVTGVIDSTTNTNGLFVTTNGTTPGYNASSTTIVTAEKLFTVGTASEIVIDYDVLVGGENNYDYMKMFLTPATEEFPAATSAPTWASSSYSTYAYYFPTRSAYNLCLTTNTIHVSAIMPNPNTNPDATSTAKVVFVWKNDGTVSTAQPGAVISNLTVAEVSCPQPSNLTANNINTTSADVLWTAGSNESDWTLEYKETTNTTWNPISVSGTASYQLTGLTAGTNYDLRVKANCSATDESFYTYATFNTPVCDLTNQCAYTFTLSDTWGDGWEGSLDIQQNGVTIANIYLDNGYTSTETVMLCDNVSTSLVWNSGGTYDYESSFTISDPAGNVLYASSGTPSGTMFTFTTDCSATPQGPCTAPSNLVSSNISPTGATVSWTPGDTETQWNLQYKSVSDNDWSTSIQTNSPNFTFNGLTANTIYLVRVQAICTSGVSDWSMTASFTTLQEGQETCYAPTDLTASNITADGVTLDWNQQGTPDSWTIKYRKTYSSSWTAMNTSSHPCTLSNLETGTEFEAFVTAMCGEQISGESNHITFTPTGVNDYLLSSTSLYPNPTTGVFKVQNSKFRIQSVEVYDVYGKLMSSVEVNDNTATLDATSYASGVYFARIITEKGVVTKRIVKK